MGKLKSPSCLLAGTPLSADEMKQITGGMNSYKVCICTFYSEKRVARTEELKVDTEASCSAGLIQKLVVRPVARKYTVIIT